MEFIYAEHYLLAPHYADAPFLRFQFFFSFYNAETFLSRDQTIFLFICVQIASIGLSLTLLTPSGPTTCSMWLCTVKNLGLVI